MNKEEEKYISDVQNNLEKTQAYLDYEQMSKVQKDMFQQEQQLSIATEQLNMTDEIERLSNLLRGRFQERNKETGEMEWRDSIDNSTRILSEEGVQFVLNSMGFYLHKGTLLSNYDEDTILVKMEDYAESLNDTLFMRSQIYFLDPSYEEVVKAYEKQLAVKIAKRIAIANIRGEIKDPIKVREEILKEADVESAIEGLKLQMKNDKLRGFNHLHRVIQDIIHSTYLRALGGQERRTLRQQVYISEQHGTGTAAPESKKLFGWFKK